MCAVVLMIDDESAQVEAMRVVLESAGHRVESAGTGSEGLSLARTVRPDLAIVDLLLPGEDGFALCEQLRADPGLQSMRILVLSALREKMQFGREAPDMEIHLDVDGYLEKPITNEELLNAVREVLAAETG